LCIAYREISDTEYQKWVTVHEQAAATINGRGEALDQAAEIIEKDLFLLGATAIEDKLQEGVPDTIHTLQQAGIKVLRRKGSRGLGDGTDYTRYRSGFSPATGKRQPSILACRVV
jgi:phospholipid-transporting ATPase